MKAILIANGVALIVAAATSIAVAWVNRGSSNAVLAASALLGTIMLYSIQLSFELRRSEEKERLSFELTVDRKERSIRQSRYTDASGLRVAHEVALGQGLEEGPESPFSIDRKRLTRDFAVRSFVNFLTTVEYDWQLERKAFVGSASGSVTFSRPVSTADEATFVTSAQLEDALKKAGNAFPSSLPYVPAGALRLPPGSSFAIGTDWISLHTPFVELHFAFEIPEAVSFMEPGTGGQAPQLTDGEPRFETRWIGVTVTRTFLASRAQSPLVPKYRAWTDRLVLNARTWFEGG